MQKLYASAPVQYKSWCTTNIWYLNLTYITNVTQIYYICKYNFHFILPRGKWWWTGNMEKKVRWHTVCQRFMAWFKPSTSQWHGCKQFVPDSNRFDRWSKPSTLKNTHIATGMAPSWRYFKPCILILISGKKQLKTAPYKSYHTNVYWLVWCFSYLQWLSNNSIDITVLS